MTQYYVVICSVCRKILKVKDEVGELDNLFELYVEDVIEAKISHSYCEKCAEDI